MARDQAGAPSAPGGGLGFRRDIQGVRALAVALVVVNHLFPSALSGGYVGVDVFLVVSGYLITALMLREADRTGRISLAGFYARRARRILPAATVVVVVTVLASFLTLALLRTRTVLVDAVWTTFFLGNVRMASVGNDYFASDAPPSPLRHYWSLAVEEQFYLLWPLLLALVVAGAMRRHGGRPELVRRWACLLLAGVLIGSVAWSLHSTAASPTTAYYSTFARAFELGVGALLALVPRTLSMPRAVREVAVLGGLAAIGWAAWSFSDETAFPGAAALVPVLGAAAVLLAGEGSQAAYGSRALGVYPAVKLGDWSYSLYLWHWPVIVLVGANVASYTWALKVATLVGVLVLSWASYRWVENPFRNGRPWRAIGARRPVRAGLAIYPASVVAALAVVLGAHLVVDQRLSANDDVAPVTVADHPEVVEGEGESQQEPTLEDLVEASVAAAEEGHEVPGRLTPTLTDLERSTADMGECEYLTGTRRLCPRGDTSSDRDLVVLGDSLARAISPAVVRIGEEHGFRVHVLGYAGCASTSLVQIEKGTRRPWRECQSFKRWTLKVLDDLDPELVLVASSAGTYVDPDSGDIVREKEGDKRYERLLRKGWEEHLRTLRGRADRVAVFANTPRLEKSPAECLTDDNPTLADCTMRSASKAVQQAALLMDAARRAGAEVVDAQRWFCAEGRCPMVVGEYITLRDTHHVTPQYAEQIAEPLAVELGLVEQTGGTSADRATGSEAAAGSAAGVSGTAAARTD